MFSRNVFHVDQSLFTGWTIFALGVAQVAVLLLQEVLGPRFSLLSGSSASSYQYRRKGIVDPEATLPAIRDSNCVVCLADVNVREDYMLTPCNHIFHPACLEQCMRYRLECPTCRAPLPEM